MSSEPSEVSSASDASPASGDTHQPSPQTATVVVRGEAVNDQDRKSGAGDEAPAGDKQKDPPRKQVSQVKEQLRQRLPALDDDADVGAQKDQVVVRDGKPDLAFTGTLLASAAPPSAPKGQWQEYRIYETTGGKHVFSKVARSIFTDDDHETHEAEVFDPEPSSVSSKLLKSARDLAHTRAETWVDAAERFFGYDALAKDLYRKLGGQVGGQFEEHIT